MAGVAAVFGFAPFEMPLLPLAALAVLFLAWNAQSHARAAAAAGFAFGLGMYGAGVSWVYVALAGFGEMPPLLAALATLVFVAYVALWPALAGYVAVRCTRPGTLGRVLAAAGAWTLAEWTRGWLFTGFPWLAVGYAQLPGSFLAGLAPTGGVYLVSLGCAVTAAVIARCIEALVLPRPARALAAPLALGITVCVAGALLGPIGWTRPGDAPLTVSLLQGNVSEEQKFDPAFREQTFHLYAELAAQSRGRLVVLPESAFPMFAQQVPASVVDDLMARAGEREGLVLVGLFTAERPLPGSGDPRYYNTVAALGPDAVTLYRKRHLVPFGESIPFKALLGPLIDSVLAIPLADQTAGDPDQAPFEVAGHRIAVNICYEDAFGSELIPAARQADILVNVTNDAWYGQSIAAWQHNQIAAMRALELGRPMLRATNTGITSVIGIDGRVQASLPWFRRGILEVTVRGQQGFTPYVRFGDAPALALCALLVLAPAVISRRRQRPAPGTATTASAPRVA